MQAHQIVAIFMQFLNHTMGE